MKKILLVGLMAAIFQCQASPRERLFAAIARAKITGRPLVLTVERKSYWQGTQGKRLKHALELGVIFAIGNGLYKATNFVTSEEFLEDFQEQFKQMSEYRDMRDAKDGMHTYVSGIAAIQDKKTSSLLEQWAFKRVRNILLDNRNPMVFRLIKQECERFYSEHSESVRGTLEFCIEEDLSLEKGTLTAQENFLEKKFLNFVEYVMGFDK